MCSSRRGFTASEHAQQLSDTASFCYREEAIISVFENNTNAVVNVFDVTLQVCCGPTVPA